MKDIKSLNIDSFQKKYNCLVCIDSDGTAMDVMNVKHFKCFGPCFVTEWELDEHREEALKLWNEINLFTATRGYNRFITLLDILTRYNGKYLHIDDLEELRNWVTTTKELSHKSLEEEIQKNNSITLRKTLNWSIETNKAIAELTFEDKKPFDGVREFLEYASDKADIAVISSAGFDAIYEEWEHFDLLKYVGVLVGQETGSKQHNIGEMLRKGYDKQNVIKVGDALADLDAAKANGVNFYPILPGYEINSWKDFKDNYFDELIREEYLKHQENLVEQFKSILK